MTRSETDSVCSGVLLNDLERTINQLSLTPAAHSNADFVIQQGAVEPRYFDTFRKRGFVPQNTTPIREEFARLASHMKWQPPTKHRCSNHDRYEPGCKKYLKERNQCFAQELRYHSDVQVGLLPALQNLCEELGVRKIPASITKCKKARPQHFPVTDAELTMVQVLHTFHINIFDFIDAKRAGAAIPCLPSKKALCKYSADGNIFPKKAAKASGVSVFLETLFHGRSD